MTEEEFQEEIANTNQDAKRLFAAARELKAEILAHKSPNSLLDGLKGCVFMQLDDALRESNMTRLLNILRFFPGLMRKHGFEYGTD